jgi:putative tryptophan/tyrosine transport system substrate-binding protein
MRGQRAIVTLTSVMFALMLAVGSGEARPRIAFLSLGAAQEGAALVAAFADGLRRLGYAEGQNLDIDYRYAAGEVEQLKSLAQDLIALKPDMLVGSEPSAARALKSVAPTLPIVCLALTDALIPDLIASYARPAGTVTGMAQSVEGVTGKLVEVALEIIPGAVRIGFLSNPAGASMRLFAQIVDTAAGARGIAVLTEHVSTAGQLAPAFDRFRRQGTQAVIVPANGLFRVQRAQLAQLALAARLPTISAERQYVEAGLLASYGVNEGENYRRAAGYVDRILKGAKPGDLPVEFPTRVELTINLRTAKALGVDLPPTFVTRADEVIE